MKKFLGFFLLFLGLGIIFYTLFISFEMVSGSRDLPEIFPTFSKEKSISQKEINFPKNLQDLQKVQEEIIAQQISNLFPPDYLQRIFNLIAWSIMSAIFIFGGSQLSSLGIKLIK